MLLYDLVNNGCSNKNMGIDEIKVENDRNPVEVPEHLNSHFCSIGVGRRHIHTL